MEETMVPPAQPALRLVEAPEVVHPRPPFPAPRTDAELMARTAAGDREAFGTLVERHKDGLVAYLARLSGDRDRGEDLAQEAFLRLWDAAGKSYREQGQLAAFLYRIATNLLRSEERRTKRWRLITAGFRAEGKAGEPAAALPSAVRRAGEARPSDRLLQAERRRHLALAVSALPFHLRVPLVLAEIEEWPQREIARLLGCREGTIKSRLFRARERLRDQLARYFAPQRAPHGALESSHEP